MKKIGIALFLSAALLLCAGCSSRSNLNLLTPQAAPAAPAPAAAESRAQDTGISGGMDKSAGWGNEAERPELMDTAARDDSGDDAYGAKIIKNASISLETREFDAHVAHVRQRAEEVGGYVSNSYTSGKKPENYGDSGRYASITVRIPQGKMESFLADTRGLATVTSESSSGDDITASYYDTESRLQVYTTQRDRILKLLEKAETMEDIIALESELSRLTYEIESLTTSLRRWDNLVDYATVNVDMYELAIFTNASSSPDSMGTRISEGLRRTLSGMAVFFENLLVFLIVASPVLIILALIAVVVILLVRRSNRKHAARMATQGYAPVSGGYGTTPIIQPPAEKHRKKLRKKDKQQPENTLEPQSEPEDQP